MVENGGGGDCRPPAGSRGHTSAVGETVNSVHEGKEFLSIMIELSNEYIYCSLSCL